MDDVITIALVLKTGGDTYDHKYVNNLVNGIKSNTTVPHRIVCVTDDDTGLTTDIDQVLKFKHNWPKWWGKLELFRAGIFGDYKHILFMDLDTFIVGNIDNILRYRGTFCSLRDFYNLSEMASGLLAFNTDYIKTVGIYEKFRENPNHHMEVHAITGDQGFLRTMNIRTQYFQDLFAGAVVSYKANLLKGNEADITSQSKIVCFHGNPRPHTIDTNLATYWKQ